MSMVGGSGDGIGGALYLRGEMLKGLVLRWCSKVGRADADLGGLLLTGLSLTPKFVLPEDLGLQPAFAPVIANMVSIQQARNGCFALFWQC